MHIATLLRIAATATRRLLPLLLRSVFATGRYAHHNRYFIPWVMSQAAQGPLWAFSR